MTTAVKDVLKEGLVSDAEAEETAERILDAALAEFEAHGLRRTSLEIVARRADVNRVTIYRYFKAKDDLVRAVCLRHCRRFLLRLFAAVNPRGKVEHVIPEAFVVAMQHLRKDRLFARLIDSEPEIILPFFTVRGGPVIAALRELIAAHLREAWAGAKKRGRDIDGVAEILARLSISFVLTRESCVDLDDSEAARAFARSCLVPLLTVERS